MADDVKRALEAATEAAVASAWDRPCDEMVRDARGHIIAAAIVAFLLDMAGAQTRGIHQDDLDHHPEKVAEARRLFALAAAVERAAKEDA